MTCTHDGHTDGMVLLEIFWEETFGKILVGPFPSQHSVQIPPSESVMLLGSLFRRGLPAFSGGIKNLLIIFAHSLCLAYGVLMAGRRHSFEIRAALQTCGQHELVRFLGFPTRRLAKRGEFRTQTGLEQRSANFVADLSDELVALPTLAADIRCGEFSWSWMASAEMAELVFGPPNSL